jgi:hypothetical protein
MRLGVAFLLAGFLVAAAVTVVSEDAVPTATISASPPLPEVPSYPEFKNEILAKQPKVDHVDDEDATTVTASSSSISTTGKPVTLSDRINFASHSLGASIFAANSEAKGASSLLTSDPDGYYMSPCSAKKWVVIGLPEEVCFPVMCCEPSLSGSSSRFPVLLFEFRSLLTRSCCPTWSATPPLSITLYCMVRRAVRMGTWTRWRLSMLQKRWGNKRST